MNPRILISLYPKYSYAWAATQDLSSLVSTSSFVTVGSTPFNFSCNLLTESCFNLDSPSVLLSSAPFVNALLFPSSLWGCVDLASRDNPVSWLSRAIWQQPELCVEGLCSRRGWNPGSTCQTLLPGWPMNRWLKSWADGMSGKIR